MSTFGKDLVNAMQDIVAIERGKMLPLRTTMYYRGYRGETVLDAETHRLHGCVLGLRDTITFEGTSVSDVERAFHSSVDDYLAWCAERDEEPDHP